MVFVVLVSGDMTGLCVMDLCIGVEVSAVVVGTSLVGSGASAVDARWSG